MKVKIRTMNKWAYWFFWTFGMIWIFVAMVMSNNAKIGWYSFVFFLPVSSSYVTWLFKPDGKLGVFDALSIAGCFIRMHWVLLIAIGISIYLYPYKFLITGDYLFMIVAIIILAFGAALDNRKQIGWMI